jgi:hypothetical protein
MPIAESWVDTGERFSRSRRWPHDSGGANPGGNCSVCGQHAIPRGHVYILIVPLPARVGLYIRCAPRIYHTVQRWEQAGVVRIIGPEAHIDGTGLVRSHDVDGLVDAGIRAGEAGTTDAVQCTSPARRRTYEGLAVCSQAVTVYQVRTGPVSRCTKPDQG